MTSQNPEYTFRTSGVCARVISFDLDEENKLHNLSFAGGCNGNLKGIGNLVEGMPADKVIASLSGTECGMKNTSCPDQLAIALQQAMSERA